MFNLHVGIPGIAPNLLQSIVQAGLLKGENVPTILSQKLWKEQFRGLINAKRMDLVGHATPAWRAAETTIAELSAIGPIAASQHALLGNAENCFLKSKVYRERPIFCV